MGKYSRKIVIGTVSALFFCLIWTVSHFAYFGAKWLVSYSIPKSETSYFIDARNNKAENGELIKFRAIKAAPEKKVYFGHVWIVWPKAPPYAKNQTASGFYPKDRQKAFQTLAISLISPIAWIKGQEPIEGTMLDDKNLKPDWEIQVRINQDQYLRAMNIDNLWRKKSEYSLRAGLLKTTSNCRDYVFEIAKAIGLKTDAYNWAEFPPETFIRFAKSNLTHFSAQSATILTAEK